MLLCDYCDSMFQLMSVWSMCFSVGVCNLMSVCLRWVCQCVCLYGSVCGWVGVSARLCLYDYICIYLWLYMYACVYVSRCLRMFHWVSVCVCVSMCVSVCVSVGVRACIRVCVWVGLTLCGWGVS